MRLVRNVKVGDTWYGPAHGNADQVPDDVAEHIENPAAWEGGGGTSSEGEPAAQQEPDDGPSRPARNASHDEWVAYAVSKGYDRTEAEDTSRNDLVKLFDGD